MESTETDRNLDSTESIVVMIKCCSFVEILERASHNVIATSIKEQIGNIKTGFEKIVMHNAAQSNNKDDILRTGDAFRLRSVKFPDFIVFLSFII
jgi:hypothetical protein